MRPTFRIRAWRPRLWRSAVFLAVGSLGCAGLATSAASASGGYAITAVGAAASGGRLMVAPGRFSVARGTSEVFGVSLSSAPPGNVTVTVRRTAGNSGLAVSAGATLTFTPGNWTYPQPVTVSASASGTGDATFTVSA